MKQMNRLIKHDLVKGLKYIKFEKDRLCSSCQAEKQIGNTHPNKRMMNICMPFVGVSDPGVPGPTSKFVAACPYPDELVRDGTQEGNEPCIILHQGACSRGYKRCERARARKREVLVLLVFSCPFCRAPPFVLDIPFYRHKEMAQLYNGGVAMCYVANGEVPGRYVRVNVSVGEVREPCRSTAVGAAWILLTSPCFRRGLENHRRHGRTRGTIIACYLGKLDGTPVLFLRSLS
jgi:hypothetical protein